MSVQIALEAEVERLRAELALAIDDCRAAQVERDNVRAAYITQIERLRAELADLRDACAEKQRCIDSSVEAQRAFLADIDALRAELAECREELSALEDGMTAAHMIGYHSRDDEVRALHATLAGLKETADCRTCTRGFVANSGGWECVMRHGATPLSFFNGDAYLPSDPVRLYETGGE